MREKATILTVLTLTTLALPCLATNEVWNLILPRLRVQPDTKFSVAALQIEEQSKSLDTSGRGIRIVCPKRPEAWHMIGPSLSGDDLPLSLAVKVVAESAGYEVRLVGDVALCFQRQTDGPPTYQTGVLRGRITDSPSGHPITNATFATVWLVALTNDVWIKTDGSYAAAVTYVTRRPYVGIEAHEREDDTVRLVVSAPGYAPKEIKADFGDAADPPHIDITLDKKPDSGKPSRATR